MITDQRVRTIARQEGVTAGLAEKNYVNSWVLYALYTNPVGETLVFKGGTALSKLYFPERWRFSEDLDFTAVAPLSNVSDKLSDVLRSIEVSSGIGFHLSNVHEAGDPVEYIQIEVQYDAILGQRNTTQIDITSDETLEFPVVDHEHSYEDVPAFTVSAYSLEEILVEKLCSIFQRTRARDYYDIYHVLNQETFDDHAIYMAFREKAQNRGVTYTLENGVPAEDIDVLDAYWEEALSRLVTEHIPLDTVVAMIDTYLQRLADQSR